MKAQRAAFGAKKGALDTSDRPVAGWLDDQACPELVEGVHALTDVIGRSDALMLTAGNISDIKTAPALLKRAGRMRYLLADNATTPTGYAARYVTLAPFRSSPADVTASEPSATIRIAIAAATSSRMHSAG